MVSPFHSPPSTPSSPGVRSRPGEAEEVPVSFDQPPEGTHLPCYNKVRTRGSIKRRPPSRRFRRSQSDCGDLGDFRAPEPSQENGAREENGDDVFPTKSKTVGSPQSNEGAMGEGAGGTLGSAGKPPLRRTCSSPEKPEEQARSAGEDGEEAGQSPGAADQHPAQTSSKTCSPEAENGCGSPAGETVAKEASDAEKTAAETEEGATAEEDELAQKSPDMKTPEEAAVGTETPASPPAGSGVLERQEEGNPLEIGHESQSPRAAPADAAPSEDTRM